MSMNKRLVKYFWALPLLGMLSGCSDSAVTENSQNTSNAIQFDVTASKQTSRATAVDNDVVKDENKPFGLFAYNNSGWPAAGTTTPTGQPNFMYDQEVKYDVANNGGWTYTPLKFWTNDNISFFGYWPKVAGVTTAKADDGKMPEVEFTQNMTASDMVDFITSNNALNKTKADGVVTLEFNHVLTRVNFQARLDQSLGDQSQTHVYIKSLKVLGKTSNANSKLYSKGTFVLGDGKSSDGNGHWVLADQDIQAGDLDVTDILYKKTYTSTVVPDLNDPTTTYSVDGVQVSDKGEVTDLLKTTQTKQEYLFLIPPTKNGIENADEEATPNAKADIKVMLDYDVVSEDPNIPGYKGIITENKDVVVPLKVGSLAQGKAYNVIFTVGLYAVKVDVDVKDWEDDVTSHAPAVDAAGNADTDIIEAWKKANNQKAANTKDNYFVIKAANKPTGDLDLRTNVDAGEADLSAFQLGDQVELLFEDDKDGTGYTIEDHVSVPNGWVCEDRLVDGVTRHVMTKVANYITEKTTSEASNPIAAALTALNNRQDASVHYYAVNVYNTTTATSLDLKNENPTLGKFGANDYIYIIFKTDDGTDRSSTYIAPDGWEFVKTKTAGKYRLQLKSSSTTGTGANLAIGDAGFNLNGGTVNVNK